MTATLGFTVGVLALATFRFATVPAPLVTHHHANWAVFVNGTRLDLSDERFMEDVASCVTSPEAIRPQDRVHLHEGDADVVHVHHPAATWGQLLANLEMAVGPDYLFTPDGVRHMAGGDTTMTFVRNGQRVYDLSNEPVNSLDRVVISYGIDSPEQVLESHFVQVADNAAEHNEQADPAACMGGHEPESFSTRVKRAFLG